MASGVYLFMMNLQRNLIPLKATDSLLILHGFRDYTADVRPPLHPHHPRLFKFIPSLKFYYYISVDTCITNKLYIYSSKFRLKRVFFFFFLGYLKSEALYNEASGNPPWSRISVEKKKYKHCCFLQNEKKKKCCDFFVALF